MPVQMLEIFLRNVPYNHSCFYGEFKVLLCHGCDAM
jgi:hypothetical protein